MDQREFWNSEAVRPWIDLADKMDVILGPIGAHAMDALDPQPGERILDVGCGTGATSRAIAARVAPGGRVLGLDVSEPFLAAARHRSEGVAGLDFHHGDAGADAIPGVPFDGIFSRFGVMFFHDPQAAFTHLRGALKPGGRLAFVCWRDMKDNAWMREPMAAVLPFLREPPPPPEPDAPGPFAFANGARVRTILEGAGWQQVAVDRFDPAYLLGHTPEEAASISLRIGPVGRLIREQQLDPEPIRAAFASVLARHQSAGGVIMDAACWLVTARA